MTIVRTYHDKQNPYTTLNNQAIFDSKISNGARGLWAQCMARKDDWVFYMTEIEKHTTDGKTALSSQINELILAGYVARLQVKEKVNGKLVFKSVDYIFFESKITPEKKLEFLEHFKKSLPYSQFLEPKPKQAKSLKLKKCFPQSGFPHPEVPHTENPQLVNTDGIITDLENTHLEESIKEDVENVHNSNACAKSDSDYSILSHEKEVELDYQDPDLIELLGLESHYLEFFPPDLVARWVGKFGALYVLRHIKYFFEVRAKQKVPIPNPEAWMEIALQKNYIKQNRDAAENKTFAEKLKKTYGWKNLKINKRYCQDTLKGKDLYYALPPEQFKKTLVTMMETKDD